MAHDDGSGDHDPEDRDPDVLVAGETLVDFLPDGEGPLSGVESFRRRAGGAPANVAVALSRLDCAPWFWTRVGADEFGEFLVETLREYGVPERFVERDPDAKTTLAFVAHEGSDPSFSFYREGTADTRLEPGRIPDDVLDGVERVVLGGVALSTEPARGAVLDLAERANEREATVFFDPNARPELWTDRDFGEAIDEILPLVDVVKAADGDLRAAGFDGDLERIAMSVLDRGPHTAVFTLGKRGALVRSNGSAPWGAQSFSAEGYDVEAIDATGAGDAFLAGVVAGLAEEQSIRDAVAFANAVAARSTTGEGAMSALPDRDEVAFRE